MPAPLFTIVIPTFNRPDFLAQAVESVLAQTVDDFECIVVDDHSDEPVNGFVDSRIKVIRHAVNRGGGAAFNTGIDAARGQYVAFMGDDDLLTPDRLAIGLKGVAKSPVGLCWSRGIDAPWVPRRPLNGNVHDVIMDTLAPSLGSTVVERRLLLRFDERYRASQDIEWWIRTSQRLEVCTIEEVGYLVRKHSGIRHGNGAKARAAASIQLMNEYRSYFDAHPTAKSFRWRQVGMHSMRAGEKSLARRAFWNSYRASPNLRALLHLARSYRRHPGLQSDIPS